MFGTMLRVTAVTEVATPGYTVLGWRVGDIDRVIAGLTAKGVSFTRYNGMDQAGRLATPKTTLVLTVVILRAARSVTTNDLDCRRSLILPAGSHQELPRDGHHGHGM